MKPIVLFFISAAMGFVGWMFFYIFFLNHVEPPLVGVEYNSATGQISLQTTPGWYRTSFFSSVGYADPRPFQVCLNIQYSRTLNCKLLKFDVAGISEFIQLHGLSSLSYNTSWAGPCYVGQTGEHIPTCNTTKNIVAGYAFSDQKEPFYKVLEETKSVNPLGQ